MEVSNYMKDGMIADWDTFEQVNLPLSAQGKRSKNLVELKLRSRQEGWGSGSPKLNVKC